MSAYTPPQPAPHSSDDPLRLLKATINGALASGSVVLAERLLLSWAEQHEIDCWVSFVDGNGVSYAFTGVRWERWDDQAGAVPITPSQIPTTLTFQEFAE